MKQSEMKPGRGGARVSKVGAGRLAGNALTVCGAVLCLSPVGFWLQPENLAEPGAVAIRVALSSVVGGIGYCLFRLGRSGGDVIADGNSRRSAVAKPQPQPAAGGRVAGQEPAMAV